MMGRFQGKCCVSGSSDAAGEVHRTGRWRTSNQKYSHSLEIRRKYSHSSWSVGKATNSWIQQWGRFNLFNLNQAVLSKLNCICPSAGPYKDSTSSADRFCTGKVSKVTHWDIQGFLFSPWPWGKFEETTFLLEQPQPHRNILMALLESTCGIKGRQALNFS